MNGISEEKLRKNNSTINSCVLNNDPECHADRIWEWGTVPYFCGEDPICATPSYEAFDRAVLSLRRFLFVGITEDYRNSTLVLEKMMPSYFRSGIHDLKRTVQS